MSNGTIDLTNENKVHYVAELARDFKVISEVGSKDQAESDTHGPEQVDLLHQAPTWTPAPTS